LFFKVKQQLLLKKKIKY